MFFFSNFRVKTTPQFEKLSFFPMNQNPNTLKVTKSDQYETYKVSTTAPRHGRMSAPPTSLLRHNYDGSNYSTSKRTRPQTVVRKKFEQLV